MQRITTKCGPIEDRIDEVIKNLREPFCAEDVLKVLNDDGCFEHFICAWGEGCCLSCALVNYLDENFESAEK